MLGIYKAFSSLLFGVKTRKKIIRKKLFVQPTSSTESRYLLDNVNRMPVRDPVIGGDVEGGKSRGFSGISIIFL